MPLNSLGGKGAVSLQVAIYQYYNQNVAKKCYSALQKNKFANLIFICDFWVSIKFLQKESFSSYYLMLITFIYQHVFLPFLHF